MRVKKLIASKKQLTLQVGHVERFNAGRHAAAYRENRDYPRRILGQLEPRYVAAGWGRGLRCEVAA